MTEKNEKNNRSASSNDISEMLRLLRESVDSEKNAKKDENDVKDAEIIAADDEIKASLEKVFEETSLALKEDDNEDDDIDVFEEDEETPSWFAIENEEDDEEFEYEDEADEASSETSEETEETKEPEEDKPEEEDPDDESPWYPEEPGEEDSEETEEPEEIEEVEELEEDKLEEGPQWYAVEPVYESEEVSAKDDEDEVIPLEDQSIWYTKEDPDEAEDSADEEFYQDESFDDEDSYDEDFDEDSDEPEKSSPEDDYAEENVYIYDAANDDEPDYIYEIADLEESNNSSTEDEGDNESAIDETDMSFLSTLGIAASEESQTADSYEEELAGDISFDYDGGEYVLENQRHEISAGYRNEKKLTLIRLIVSGAVALLLLVYEMLPILGIDLPGMLSYTRFPLSHIMISLQLLIVCVIMSAKQLYIGLADLIYKNATPYSVSAVLVVINILHSIVMAIFSSSGLGLYNFVGAFAVLMGIAYEYLLLFSEEHIFGVFSTKKGQKFAFVTDNDDEETSAGGGITLRAYATDFNKNYFLRMRKRSVDYKYLTLFIPIVLLVAVVTFVVSLICQSGLRVAFMIGTSVVNFGLPVGVLGAFSYPIFRASVKALGKRGAVVGNAAVDEYSNTRFVVFGEEELFTSLKTTHLDLKPAGNDNISDVLRKTSMLLSAVGGPMKKMVEVMQGDFAGSEAEIDEVFDDGVSMVAEGARMLAGSAQFLRQHGIEVDEATDFMDVDESNEVLYVSIDGKLAARYYLKYKPETEFIKLANALGARGISVGIRTRNPGINSDIIARRCPEMRYKVYTIKSRDRFENDTAVKSTTDSGLVATGSELSLAYPLLAACDLKKYYKVDRYVRIVSAALGVVAIIINAILGSAENVSALNVVAHQLLWCLPTLLFGLFHFKHRSKRKKFKIVYR